MRKISYTCDGCGKELSPKLAIKLNISKQRGAAQTEKNTFDFCAPCFLRAKTAFLNTLGGKPEPVDDKDLDKPEQELEIVSSVSAVAPPVNMMSLSEIADKLMEKSADEPIKNQMNEPENRCPTKYGNLLLGPISPEDRTEILRLHVEEGLSPEQIAQRMNRLARGIKRAINTASRTGELARLKAEWEAKNKSVQFITDDEEEDEGMARESHIGSGVSNSGILKDGYTAPPKIEVINGKKYDVGSILALAKAGWSADDIADERNYDLDVVAVILEKYIQNS